MEKTVFNIKVSEQYFDHSNKDYGGNTNINWCRMLLHYSLCTAEWMNGKMKDSAGMLQSCQTFKESTIIFWMEFENMAVYARVNLKKNVKKHPGHASTPNSKEKKESLFLGKLHFILNWDIIFMTVRSIFISLSILQRKINYWTIRHDIKTIIFTIKT